MSDTIVVGTDGSETAQQAVAEAVRVGKALDAQVHVVVAYHPLTGAKITGAPAAAAKVWAPSPDDEARSIADQAAAAVRVGGLDCKTHVLEDDPADALLEVAADAGATLIVVGSKGMTGARRLLGSVPNKLSHHAQCNLLIVATHKSGDA